MRARASTVVVRPLSARAKTCLVFERRPVVNVDAPPSDLEHAGRYQRAERPPEGGPAHPGHAAELFLGRIDGSIGLRKPEEHPREPRPCGQKK